MTDGVVLRMIWIERMIAHLGNNDDDDDDDWVLWSDQPLRVI